jgi:hypothetical protein
MIRTVRLTDHVTLAQLETTSHTEVGDLHVAVAADEQLRRRKQERKRNQILSARRNSERKPSMSNVRLTFSGLMSRWIMLREWTEGGDDGKTSERDTKKLAEQFSQPRCLTQAQSRALVPLSFVRLTILQSTQHIIQNLPQDRLLDRSFMLLRRRRRRRSRG